jgi:putative zinc finger protein
MRVSCLMNRRLLSRYLDGELPAGRASRIEDHMASCGVCRAEYVRLRAARSFARQLPEQAPRRDLWPAMEMALKSTRNAESDYGSGFFKRAFGRPSYISIATAVIGILMMAIGVSLTVGGAGERRESKLEPDLARIDTNNFRQVSIDGIKNSSDPHIAAEGYVSDINVDEEDGDLTFRLVSDPSHPQSFVVCEIIDSIKVKPPRAGSRIRVYGVSRYDGQAGHNWYEVHPVLGIEPATR